MKKYLLLSEIFLFIATSIYFYHFIAKNYINSSAYILEIPTNYTMEENATYYKNWKNSLIRSLDVKEEGIYSPVFFKTDINITKNGEKIIGTVYQNIDNNKQFLILQDEEGYIDFIIDFISKKVATFDPDAFSSYLTPDKKMAVLIEPNNKPDNLFKMTIGCCPSKGNVFVSHFNKNVVDFLYRK